MKRDYLLVPNVRPMHAIICEVANKYGLTHNELVSNRRSRQVAWPRQEAMWRCAKETTFSLPDIGRALGGRDHTTVIYGIRRYEQRMRANG